MSVEFEIPKVFLAYTDAAIVRMGYLFPQARISLNDATVCITVDSDQGQDLMQEFLHLIYREKIYEETLDIRKELFKGFVD